jgi:hypothetical protein
MWNPIKFISVQIIGVPEEGMRCKIFEEKIAENFSYLMENFILKIQKVQ